MKAPPFLRGERMHLLRQCKKLFAESGHDPRAAGATVVAMVSALAGYRMDKMGAWWWLYRLHGSTPTLQVPPQKGKLVIKRKATAPTRTVSASFYESRAWRDLRYQALALSDGCCELCGRSKRDGVVLHVDHIKPRSLFPRLELILENLQVLCEDCNLGKSNKDSRDWRAPA